MNNLATSELLLECREITKIFPDATQNLQILQGVNLQVKRGSQVAIMGRSGSGKTTLLQVLGGLDSPSSGEVLLNGVNIARMPELQRAQMRNKQLGFIYQLHHLLPEFTAEENVALPMLIAGRDPREALQAAHALLREVGLVNRASHYPGTLSGGERQRVAIARALVMNPACVLADEPTGNLDRENAEHALVLIKKLSRERGTTFIVVTHDSELSKAMDMTYLLQDGRLSHR